MKRRAQGRGRSGLKGITWGAADKTERATRATTALRNRVRLDKTRSDAIAIPKQHIERWLGLLSMPTIPLQHQPGETADASDALSTRPVLTDKIN